MRDTGLEQAIKAVGGISALARGLGVAQPSVSNWTRVPAERVLAVETLTAVPRTVLRPDLYPASQDAADAAIDSIDQARGQVYLLLANLIGQVPQEHMLAELARMPRSGDGVMGGAVAALAEAAGSADVEDVQREHFTLFVGVGRGELLPYASYYRTGFLYERPLVNVREDLKILGLARGDGSGEPEDNIGFLCEVMAGMVLGRFAAPESFEAAFFKRHIASWAEKFFADLETAEAAQFYRAVGHLGRIFIGLEREAFALETGTDLRGTSRHDDLQRDNHDRKAS